MQVMRRIQGPLLLTALALLPLLFWATSQPLASRYATTITLFNSLGQISSLVGLSLFSLSLVLSMRTAWLDWLFDGLNRVYIIHHITGGISFILLLLHPLFLSYLYTKSSLLDAAKFLLPGSDWLINLGIAALFFMMSLLILTYYIKLPYHIWKFTHKLLGVAFVFGGIHSLLIPSDIANNPWLRAYMLGLMLAGLGSYVYWTVLGKFITRRYAYEIIGIKQLPHQIIELTLKPSGKGVMHYRSGQFVFISFDDATLGNEAHPFSLSSDSGAGVIQLAAKALGDYTALLSKLNPGTRAWVQGPYGSFLAQAHGDGKQVWVAGGIGMTPFFSKARDYFRHEVHQAVDLYYCVKNLDEAVYLAELQAIAQKLPNFRVYPYFSHDQGRLTAQRIVEISGLQAVDDFFICGPPPMMHALKQQLRSLGIKGSRIHTEEFSMS